MEVLPIHFSLVVIRHPNASESSEQKRHGDTARVLRSYVRLTLDYTFPYDEVCVLSVECLSMLAHTLQLNWHIHRTSHSHMHIHRIHYIHYAHYTHFLHAQILSQSQLDHPTGAVFSSNSDLTFIPTV